MTIKKNPRVAREQSDKSTRADLEGIADSLDSLQSERELLVGILETLSQSRHMNEYLEKLVVRVQNYAGCQCVGIRLLDDEGNIPYVSYVGFSPEFYESESHLCVKWDKGTCINVLKGNTDPGLPFYTDGGSFFSNFLIWHEASNIVGKLAEQKPLGSG